MTGKYRQVCRGEHCSPVAFTRQVDLQGRLQRAVNDRPYGLTRDFYYPVGRGDPTPPGKAFPLGGKVARYAPDEGEMSGKLPLISHLR